MRRVVLILAAAVTAAATAACGGGEVAVLAQLEGASTGTEADTTQQASEAVALSSLPIRLLPYDRDVVFDSLEQAYPEPEPEIPDTIQDLQNRVIASQNEWRAAEQQWAQLRDSLQTLSDTLSAMNQADPDYFVLFQDFGDLEGQVNRLERQSQEAFREFEQLQSSFNQQAREIELARRNWADEAFASVDSVFGAMEEELGREVMYDTTSAQGVVRFVSVPEGQWWVNARYERQYDELYWNVPVDVPGGEEVVVRLTEENAQVRQKL